MKVGRISSLGEASDLPVRPAVSRLFESISSFEALNNAWVQSRKHKRYSASATEFAWLEPEVYRELREELQSGSYFPGEYRLFSIREPQPRIITAAPFRDRVVHHALVAALTPKCEPSFSFDSYATRVGKGTHAALLCFHQYLRRYQFVLKCDIAKFFPSMDHQVLKSILRRKVTCRQTLRLIDYYYPGDVTSCLMPCGGTMVVLGVIEDPVKLKAIIEGAAQQQPALPEVRGPPGSQFLSFLVG